MLQTGDPHQACSQVRIRVFAPRCVPGQLASQTQPWNGCCIATATQTPKRGRLRRARHLQQPLHNLSQQLEAMEARDAAEHGQARRVRRRRLRARQLAAALVAAAPQVAAPHLVKTWRNQIMAEFKQACAKLSGVLAAPHPQSR